MISKIVALISTVFIIAIEFSKFVGYFTNPFADITTLNNPVWHFLNVLAWGFVALFFIYGIESERQRKAILRILEKEIEDFEAKAEADQIVERDVSFARKLTDKERVALMNELADPKKKSLDELIEKTIDKESERYYFDEAGIVEKL